MKRTDLVVMLAMVTAVMLSVSAAQGQICLTEQGVDIALYPGNSPNIIDPKLKQPIPVLIFGSETVDATTIDAQSLRLRVHAMWEPSRVASVDGTVLCEPRDVGSPGRQTARGLGPRDGIKDLLCQFTHDIAIIPDGVQQIVLTGEIVRGRDVTPISGFDYASGPGGLEDIVRCCISCDADGGCSGCNADTSACTDFLRTCSGDLPCYDCTGCSAPTVC